MNESKRIFFAKYKVRTFDSEKETDGDEQRRKLLIYEIRKGNTISTY